LFGFLFDWEQSWMMVGRGGTFCWALLYRMVMDFEDFRGLEKKAGQEILDTPSKNPAHPKKPSIEKSQK
jgi:hypothetical protein